MLVSVGGPGNAPAFDTDPTAFGSTAASFANLNFLDGVDFLFDGIGGGAYEGHLIRVMPTRRTLSCLGLPGFSFTPPSGSSAPPAQRAQQVISWLRGASTAARAALGQGRCAGLISHAPQVGWGPGGGAAACT